jgi:outer membrane immunogenic protein
MKSWISAAAIAATLAAASTSFAADIAKPVYKAPPVVVPAYNWTGFYIGGNAGYGWGDRDVTITHNNAAFFGGAFAAGATPSLYHLSTSGFVGGGQVGYNWQAGAWVFGIEGDISYTGLQETQNINTAIPPFVNGFGSASHDLNWLATVRGRIGYAWDNFLVFGTGGVAWGDVEYRYSFAFPATNELYSLTTSKTQTGWTVGGGFEYGIGAWSFKAEYLYFNLNDGGTYAAIPSGAGTIPGRTHFATFDDTTGQIVRVGLNYRFNYSKAPVVARY